MTYWQSAGPQIRRVAFWLLITIAAGGMAYCAFVNSPAQAGGYGGEENGEGENGETDPEPGPDPSPDPSPDPDPGPSADPDPGPDIGPDGDSPNQERCEGRGNRSPNRFWKPHTDPCPPLRPAPKPRG